MNIMLLALVFNSAFCSVYAKDVIRVVGDIDFAPYSYEVDGKYYGADIEMMELLAQTLNVEIEIDLKPWDKAQEDFNNNLYDVIFGVDSASQNVLNNAVLIPIHNDNYVTFGKSEMKNVSDLYDQKIGVLNGSSSYEQFILPYGLEANTVLYDGYSDVFEALNNDEIEYAIASYSVGKNIINENNYRTIFASGPHLRNLNYSIMINENSSLPIDEILNAMAMIARSGKIQSINEKWILKYNDMEALNAFIKDNSIIIMTGGLFIFFIIILVTKKNYDKRLSFINEQISLERRMHDYDEYIRETTKELFDYVFEFDITNNVPINEMAKEVFKRMHFDKNVSYNQMLTRITNKMVDEEYREDYLHMHNKQELEKLFKSGHNTIAFDFKSVNQKMYQVTTKIFYWENAKSYHIIQFIQDITDEVRLQEELSSKASKDLMTDLYNKVTVEEEISNAILKGNKDITSALIVLDIDNFKSINDQHGHLYGDIMIKKVAQQIKSSFRNEDIIGRIGGDEFIVYINNIGDTQILNNIITRLLEKLQIETDVDGHLIEVSSSVGVALIHGDRIDFKMAYRNADRALYQSKQNGKNRFAIYEDKLEETIL